MTDRCRVLHVIDSLAPGGAERSLVESLDPLADRGIDSTVVTLWNREPTLRLEVEPARLRAGIDRGSRVATVRALRRVIRDAEPDVVHTSLVEASITGRLAALGLAPVLSSIVSDSYGPVRPGVDHRRLRAVQIADAVTARACTRHLHAISDWVAGVAVRRLGVAPHRITVIPRGRDIRRLGTDDPGRRLAARERFGCGDRFTIVAIGRQDARKGHGWLLDAVARLTAPGHLDACVLVAGAPGNASPELHNLHRRLGLGDRVRFLGYVTDVGEVLAASDVFVFPSEAEGFGGAMIEALGFGRPVIASDIPPLRDISDNGRTAELVPVGDVDALAVTLAGLAAEPARRDDLARAGRERFDTTYRVDLVTDRMTTLYRSVRDGDLPGRRDRPLRTGSRRTASSRRPS